MRSFQGPFISFEITARNGVSQVKEITTRVEFIASLTWSGEDRVLHLVEPDSDKLVTYVIRPDTFPRLKAHLIDLGFRNWCMDLSELTFLAHRPLEPGSYGARATGRTFRTLLRSLCEASDKDNHTVVIVASHQRAARHAFDRLCAMCSYIEYTWKPEQREVILANKSRIMVRVLEPELIPMLKSLKDPRVELDLD